MKLARRADRQRPPCRSRLRLPHLLSAELGESKVSLHALLAAESSADPGHRAPPPPPPPPPSGFAAPPPPPPFLPPGWTEHKASGGAPYWYNALTGQSTFTRPVVDFSVPPPGFPPFPPNAAAPVAPVAEKKKKKDKPKDKVPVPGTSWIRVTTTEGNVFYMNKETKKSEWTVPEEISVSLFPSRP